MKDPLREATSTAHSQLTEHLDEATAAVRDHVGRREAIQKTDAFLIHACRHLSAVCDVILPAARDKISFGTKRAHAYVRQARRVERAVVQTKRRLYGELHTVDMPWSQVWAKLGVEVEQLNVLEDEMVSDLADELSSAAQVTLADRIGAAEAISPTRPHPNSPHAGRLAHITRGMLARTDRFWDSAEGRIVSSAAPAPDKIAS